jgi:glyoxylase-like metal-dependent hydrolase (beta-lactamase superfamily II)
MNLRPVESLQVIFAGELTAPHGYVFRPAGGSLLTRLPRVLRSSEPPLRLPILAFALRHPTEGTILVDTGTYPDARRDLGPLMGRVFRSLRTEEPFDVQLRARGIEPAEVPLVVMTHLHADHTGAMRLLPSAEFVCGRAEWRAARAPRTVLKGYLGHHLPAEDRMRLIDGDLDLLGDGSIRLLSTPGHTPGHLSVLVRLPDRQVLLAGDAAYTLRNVEELRLPLLTEDDAASLASLRRVRALAHEATIVPSHDPEAWKAL